MDTLTITKLCEEAHDNAKAHGFDDPATTFGDRIALMHSELSEALEEFRDGHPLAYVYYRTEKPTKPEGIPIELADVVIRIADLCGKHGIDLESAIRVKLAYNRTRPHKHGRAAL